MSRAPSDGIVAGSALGDGRTYMTNECCEPYAEVNIARIGIHFE